MLKIKVQILLNFAEQKPVRGVISVFIQTVGDDLPDVVEAAQQSRIFRFEHQL